MDDSNAALLRQRDRQVRLRDGVHGGGDHRNVQCDLASEARARVHLGRDHFAAGRLEQYIVEGEALGEYVLNHGDSSHDNVLALRCAGGNRIGVRDGASVGAATVRER